MAQARRPTSGDVARRAGVSQATVSYVLNARTDQSIPEATRRRVLNAAHELAYTPNAAARALQAGRSNLVLLITSIPSGSGLWLLLDTLTDLAAESGKSLVLWRRKSPDDLAVTLTHLEPCVAIALDPLDPQEAQQLTATRVPFLEAGRGTDLDPGFPDVVSMRQIEHLVARGHSRIGYLTTGDPSLAGFAKPRRAAVERAAHELALPAPRIAELPAYRDLTVEQVVEVIAEWRADPQPITAAACYNDLYAAATLAAAARCGLSVPGDLAVIGIDDERFAPFTQPPLTTIKLDHISFAERAWAQAEELQKGTQPVRPRLTYDYVLIERGTT